LKCLHKDPQRRYGSAEALGDDLERWLAGEPILARALSPGERLLRFCARRKGLAAFLLLLTLSAALLVGLELRASAGQRAALQAARRYLYAAQLHLAQGALERGHVERALELLREQVPEPGDEDLRGFEWYHLHELCHRELTLRGHRGPVRSVTFL